MQLERAVGVVQELRASRPEISSKNQPQLGVHEHARSAASRAAAAPSAARPRRGRRWPCASRKRARRLGAAVEDHVDVGVAGGPGVGEASRPPRARRAWSSASRSQVERARGAARATPGASRRAGLAAAVARPAPDAVGAAPGACLRRRISTSPLRRRRMRREVTRRSWSRGAAAPAPRRRARRPAPCSPWRWWWPYDSPSVATCMSWSRAAVVVEAAEQAVDERSPPSRQPLEGDRAARSGRRRRRRRSTRPEASEQR